MRLDLLEAARIAHGIFDPQGLRLLRDGCGPVARVRMIAEPLRTAGSALLFNRLEHVRHVARVVSGARHDLRSLDVGLPLVLAAESQESGPEAELGSLRDHL